MTDYTELKRLAENHLSLGQAYTVAKPSVLLALIAENERLAAACERAEQVINTESKAAAIATGRANLLQGERDQLRAEVAGLKTGYEAYERVNAEMKAEVEALRKLGPSKEIIWCACGDGYAANSYGAGFMDANEGVCANCDAANKGVEPDLDTLRKDAKRYRWLRRAGTKAIALVAEHCLDALDEAIDAAMGQGEQP